MREKEIVLSIVIPAYNAEKTIVRALESVKNPSPLCVVEVIIVNDGSTDGTRKICSGYIKKNKGNGTMFRLINQRNAGHGSAINYAIKHAKGKYLRVLDADDYFDCRYYEKYLKFLLKNDSDLVCSDYEHVTLERREKFNWYFRKMSIIDQNYDGVISRTTPYLLPCAAVKTIILRANNVVLDEKCYYDDQEYDLSIIAFCRTVSYFPYVIYCYVIGRDEQSISQNSLIKNIKDHQKVIQRLICCYYDMELSDEKKDFVFSKILVPLCYQQYFIAVKLKKSKKDFLSFDNFLKNYDKLYNHGGVAGKKLIFHRLTRGLFI